MSQLTGVSHISFDLWLTLIRSVPGFKPARDQLLADHFSIPQPLEKISATARHFDRLFDRISVSTGRSVYPNEIILIILDALGVDTGQVSNEQLAAFGVDMERLFFSSPPRLIDPQTPELFDRLREKGFTLSLLSNTGFIRGVTLRKLLKHHGIDQQLDFQLYSDEIGFAKPSADAFGLLWQESRRRRPLGKEMILHIGDNPEADVRGANDFGIRSVLFDPEGKSLSELLSAAQ